MSVKIVYEDVATGAAEDAAMSAEGAEVISAPFLLPFGSENAKKYATLEHNSWILDGSRDLYDGGAVSFWSKTLSGADCTFSVPPTVTAAFDEKYSSMGIYLRFGALNYCSEVIVRWYSDGALLSERTFYPDAHDYFCENSVEAYNAVQIEFVRTSHPYSRARLDYVMFGIVREFQRGDLRRAVVTQEINLISREMAENVLDWKLSDRHGIDYMFQRRQSVSAYDGETLIGTFYITTADQQGSGLYDVSCTDAIGLLGESMFPDAIYSDKNALELATEICEGFTVEMDGALQSKTVTGILQGKTRREALQQLCFAIGAVADTSGSASIKIFAPPISGNIEIKKDRARIGGSVKESAIVTAVKLTAHSYSTSGSGDSVTVNGVTYYDTKTVVTINNPNVTASDRANVVEISNATLISAANVEEIARRMYDFYMRRYTQRLKFRLNGENVGDYVTTITPWDDTIAGNITRATIVLSGIALADAEIVGAK